ncbi:homeobox-leucine zipper protein HAT22-like [Pyrus ussuriensis x Pyrus communis]|uniref:Homeobox-leucine zipper protein HAT22-like n=1 Tax=Pyrus ussuriensis x Pyrus communis TaxID=2448454 RepID=A0A5N5HEW2_9ROSA|nr:homeobox-leucine zipper protein HAT9-like [Pyrus x bretschneideri]KAB2626405.1 homeobox-leucine zipper protein HAT22-like [Pyrus ussuriensis x Pyrus communis]
MGDVEEACNTKLQLGLGVCEYASRQEKKDNPVVCLDLSFALCPKQEVPNLDDHIANGSSVRTMDEDEESYERSIDHTNNKSVIMNNKNGVRKKLRLTKEQSTLLEESFNRHSTLNQVQKQSLAEQLNLKPRQVEVWFQNRRARTKLKQTEVDCEFLKKCCESLSDENRRLKKELQELKSLNANGTSPLYIQIPKATMPPVCPSCEKMVKAHENNPAAAKNAEDLNVVRKSSD